MSRGGGAGAESTQVRTERYVPTPAGAPPSTYAGLRFSRTLIALLSSHFFVHLLRAGECKVWAGSGLRFFVFSWDGAFASGLQWDGASPPV